MNCRDILEVSRATYDPLRESSPTLDHDVIATFNKRFNADYPNVSKPKLKHCLQRFARNQGLFRRRRDADPAQQN